MMKNEGAIPASSPPVAVDQPKAVKKAVPPTGGCDHQEKIREILRLELECAADSSLKRGDLTAAKILRKLAETTRMVEVRVLYAYAQLLDELTAPAPSSEELRQIGSDWFPETAAEYVERLVAVRHAARASAREENTRPL